MLELYGLAAAERAATALSSTAAAVLERLRDGPRTGDELVRAAGLAPGVGSAALMELELARVVTLEDGVYRASV